MKTYFVILKLFYTSSHWLLKLSFFFLPIALFFAMSSFLFIDNLLKSYEQYLIGSYIGSQGRISIESKDENFLQKLESFSTEKKLLFSPRKEIKANVVFQSPSKTIVKYAKFIILDQRYLQQKFHKQGDSNTLYINQVFFKSFGDLDLKDFTIIYVDKQHRCDISQLVKIDTGFLGNDPLVFITKDFAQKLFTQKQSQKMVIEFLVEDKKKISMLKQYAQQSAAKLKVLEYKVHDILQDTKVTKDFFQTVSIIEVGILGVLALVSIGIVVVSISVSIEFKRNSLKILHLLGMSVKDLSFTLSTTIVSIFLLTFCLSLGMLFVYQDIFLRYSGFSTSFFQPVALENIFMMAFLAVIIFLFVKGMTKYLFKGES